MWLIDEKKGGKGRREKKGGRKERLERKERVEGWKEGRKEGKLSTTHKNMP